MDVSHCGIGGWDELMETRGVVDCRFLASTTGSNISILITYIVFVTKMQKRQTLQNGFAFIGKRYHNNFL
jgi:hypothetical protein